MTSQLQVTQVLGPDGLWVVTGEILTGSSLPLDIFLYLNTGTTSLGVYQGVANLGEYQRIQTFTGTAIPVFGNKFVKYTQAKIIACPNADLSKTVTNLTTNVQNLSTAFESAASTTNVYTIT